MNTQNVNVKTAAHESSRKIGGYSLEQMIDLFRYVVENSLQQKQPTFFAMPETCELMTARSDEYNETVLVITENSWPLAVSIPEKQFLAVLTGIPL
nr:hypothetical protein [uncultured Enterobacter sp.]